MLFGGTRFRASSNQLNKDNYSQWSARLKGILMVNKVWDIVNEQCVRPPQPAVHELGVEVATPEAIAAATIAADKYDRYLEDYTRAACLLAESISDTELVAITTVFDDTVAIWTKLQRKFARVSELGKSAAQKALFQFQHLEIEIPEEKISTFESVVAKCVQHKVRMEDGILERQLLD